MFIEEEPKVVPDSLKKRIINGLVYVGLMV